MWSRYGADYSDAGIIMSLETYPKIYELAPSAAATAAEPEVPGEPAAPAPTPGGRRRRRLPATAELLQPPPASSEAVTLEQSE